MYGHPGKRSRQFVVKQTGIEGPDIVSDGVAVRAYRAPYDDNGPCISLFYTYAAARGCHLDMRLVPERCDDPAIRKNAASTSERCNDACPVCVSWLGVRGKILEVGQPVDVVVQAFASTVSTGMKIPIVRIAIAGRSTKATVRRNR